MTKRAIVIPADETKPAHEITWEADEKLLPQLYREIECRYVEASPALEDEDGVLHFWLDEEGRLSEPMKPVNPRATALALVVGWNPGVLVGNVVLTGGADEVGDTTGLTDAHREAITRVLNGKR